MLAAATWEVTVDRRVGISRTPANLRMDFAIQDHLAG